MSAPDQVNRAESASDREAMRLCLGLARLGAGHTHPNPRVGAVAVRGGRYIGLGAHLACGRRHAERLLLDSLPEGKCRGADLYVSLEPCVHQGKTAPCAPAVIRAGFRRVVVGLVDPDEKVSGRGIRLLRDAGIEVQMAADVGGAARLNAPFLAAQAWNRAWVTLKSAVSLDGRVAASDGTSQWISSGRSRERVHRWRANCDAILIGRGTFLADRPRLTARPSSDPLRGLAERLGDQLESVPELAGERRLLLKRWPHQPVRIIVDAQASCGLQASLTDHFKATGEQGGEWILAHLESAAPEALERLRRCGVRCWKLPAEKVERAEGGDRGERAARDERRRMAHTVDHPGTEPRAGVDLTALLTRLAEEGLLDVFVEGGGRLASKLIRAGLVDHYRLFQAPILLGGPHTWCGDVGVETLDEHRLLARLRSRKSGSDVLTEAYSAAADALLTGQVKTTQEIFQRCSPE